MKTLMHFITELSLILLIVYTITGLLNCNFQPSYDPVNPSDYPQTDASEACKGLCDNLNSLDCPAKLGSPGPDERYGTEDDVSCQEQCVISVFSVPWMLDKARCGSVANSCDEIDNCE